MSFWDLHDTGVTVGSDLWPLHSASALVDMIPSPGYEMEELIWENRQLGVHRLGQSRESNLATASLPKEPWELSCVADGTLESIVDRATHQKGPNAVPAADDALVPCETSTNKGMSTCSMRAGSGSEGSVPKRLETRVAGGGEYLGRQQQREIPSASGSFGGGDSFHVATVNTCQKEESSELRLHTTPFCSDTTLPSHHRSALPLLSRPQTEEEKKGTSASAKSALSTKRSRDAATTHNQSERKRRDAINQKMKTLHKLVPNSTKTDKASILDEVIDYLQKLQSQQQQLQMMMIPTMSMASMNMNMMMPLAMPPHLMSLIPPMAIMDMNMNIMTCPNPLAFVPMASWDAASIDQFASPATMLLPDATLLASCHSHQPSMTEAYSKMVALIQQQQIGCTSKIYRK